MVEIKSQLDLRSNSSVDIARIATSLWSMLLLMLLSPASYAITSIERHGIKWTFKDNVAEGNYGYFANGDPWVVGPVVITGISPAPASGRNGTMINPIPNAGTHGFDSRIQFSKYADQSNIGTALPYTVNPGSSVVSSISNSSISRGDDPYLSEINVLTVLAAPARPGDFRPPYVGTDKSLKWNVSSLNYGILPKLTPTITPPDWALMESYFEYPWMELVTNWTGRYFHPTKNHPNGNYGREMSKAAGLGLLTLGLDYPDAKKTKLFIGAVQAGIDIYGAAALGARWDADGGHNPGRKMLLLLAGKALNDQQFLSLADGSKMIFQEDQQTFIVSQAEVNLTNSSAWNPDTRSETIPYTSANIGMPEWGIRHKTDPTIDNASWSAMYRAVAGSATFPHYVAAKIYGFESEWNWPPFFAYYPRYFSKEKGYLASGGNGVEPLAADLYVKYIQNQAYEPPAGDGGSTPVDFTAAPNSNLTSGIYYGAQTLQLSSSTDGASIYYTTNGSTPTVNSQTYSSSIQLGASTVVKSMAQAPSFNESAVTTTDIKIVGPTSSEVITTSTTWGNITLPQQAESFTLGFEATPSALNLDAVVGLAEGRASQYSDLGVIIRFNPTGFIDARNGNAYEAVNAVPYQAGATYRLSVTVNMRDATYSVFLENGEQKTAIALDYSFRTEQASVSTFNYISYAHLGNSPISIRRFSVTAYNQLAPPLPPVINDVIIHTN